MRLPTADLSSWEAMGVVSGVRGWNALEDRYRRYQTASWQVSTALYSVVVGTLKEEAAMLLNAMINVYTDVEPAVMLYYSGAGGLDGRCTLAALLPSCSLVPEWRF